MLRNTNKEARGDISAISNELEFQLKDISSSDLISVANNRRSKIELTPEVNPVHVVEMMVSMAANIDELNSNAHIFLAELLKIANSLGGKVYGGSSVYEDVSNLEPKWYRTTSLSKSFARGLLEISSQQLVIGISREGNSSEAFGIRLYNMLRQLTPVLIALSASSPLKYRKIGNQHVLVPTGLQSIRPTQYQEMSKKMPQEMFATVPVNSLADYENRRRMISQIVMNALNNNRLATGEVMDANLVELYRKREDENSYAPFETLAPHQLYSMVRIRPDHANSDSLFSLEVRVCDLPIKLQTIQTINSFIVGLAYYCADFSFQDVENILAKMKIKNSDARSAIISASRNGLDTNIGGILIRRLVSELVSLSIMGLKNRGQKHSELEFHIDRILSSGNDASQVLNFISSYGNNPNSLINFLVDNLRDSVLEKNKI